MGFDLGPIYLILWIVGKPDIPLINRQKYDEFIVNTEAKSKLIVFT